MLHVLRLPCVLARCASAIAMLCQRHNGPDEVRCAQPHQPSLPDGITAAAALCQALRKTRSARTSQNRKLMTLVGGTVVGTRQEVYRKQQDLAH